MTLHQDKEPFTAAGGRFLQLCQMQHDMWTRISPAERDRIQQRHLAACQCSATKLRLLCEMTDMVRVLRTVAARENGQEAIDDQ